MRIVYWSLLFHNTGLMFTGKGALVSIQRVLPELNDNPQHSSELCSLVRHSELCSFVQHSELCLLICTTL